MSTAPAWGLQPTCGGQHVVSRGIVTSQHPKSAMYTKLFGSFFGLVVVLTACVSTRAVSSPAPSVLQIHDERSLNPDLNLFALPVDSALVYLADAILRATDTAEDIWPGFALRDKPITLYSPHDTDRALRINFVIPTASDLPLTDPTINPALAARAVLYSGPVDNLRGRIDATQQVGFDSYVHFRQISEPDLFQSLDFVIHEGFHPFQRQYFENFLCRSPRPELDVVRSTDFLNKVERERLLLSQALQSASDDSARAIVRRYLDERHERLSGIPSMRWTERHMERQEGTARWVGYRVAIGALEVDPAEIVRHIVGDLQKSLADMPDGPEEAAPLVRWRLYGTGAALSELLERFGVDWKERVQAGEALDEMLAEAVGFGFPVTDVSDVAVTCLSFAEMVGGGG